MMATESSTPKIYFGEDYLTQFNPKDYLRRFADVNVPYKIAPLKAIYELYKSHSAQLGREITVCDIGCGPVIAYVISAAPFASEIILAEYTKLNRDEIERWIHKDPSAHDWKLFFTHVVQKIEGLEAAEVSRRDEIVRSKIVAVVKTDFMASQLMATEYMREYDVVQCFLSLEQSSGSEADYSSTIRKIYHLVKPGGKFLLYTQQKEKINGPPATYHVNKAQFRFLRITFDFALKSLQDAGFSAIESIDMDDLIPPCECSDGLCSFKLFVATR